MRRHRGVRLVFLIVAGLCGLIGAQRDSFALVAPTTLQHLTEVADTIVVASVAEVTEIEGLRVAILDVTEVLKGDPPRRIAYLAQGQWTCDASGGEAGESGIYLLEPYVFDPEPAPRSDDPTTWSRDFKEPIGFKAGIEKLNIASPFFQIAWAGWGRLTSSELNGERVVDIVTYEIGSATSFEVRRGTDPESGETFRFAPFEAVRAQILAWVTAPARRSSP